MLNAPPLDFVDVNTHAGAVRGVAFILPWTPSLDARGHHRVYVRHMLLSEQEEQLTPRWAFFVKTVLDAGTLRPNAARDALRDDADLHAAREEIAGTLRDWLLGLAREQPGRLRELITLHYLSIKALAAEDVIRRMTENLQENSGSFQQVVGATGQQQIGLEQIAQGIQQIRQASMQTAASTDELAKAATNLNQLGEALTRLMEKYRL